VLIIAISFVFGFRNINKEYEGVILTKDFNIKEKVNIHFSGVKDLNYLSHMISGKIIIEEKSYKFILNKDKIINKYEGSIIDTSSELEHSIIAQVYLSNDYKELYFYFKDSDTFIIAPIDNVQKAKEFFNNRGNK